MTWLFIIILKIPMTILNITEHGHFTTTKLTVYCK